VEHLRRQREHLHVVRDYHLQAMQEFKNPQIYERHRDIANLLDLVISQYESLCAELQSGEEG
jgi:hypothetical protein